MSVVRNVAVGAAFSAAIGLGAVSVLTDTAEAQSSYLDFYRETELKRFELARIDANRCVARVIEEKKPSEIVLAENPNARPMQYRSKVFLPCAPIVQALRRGCVKEENGAPSWAQRFSPRCNDNNEPIVEAGAP